MLSYHCATLLSSENLRVKKIFLKFKVMNQHNKNMTPESIDVVDVGNHYLETFDGNI